MRMKPTSVAAEGLLRRAPLNLGLPFAGLQLLGSYADTQSPVLHLRLAMPASSPEEAESTLQARSAT